MGSEKFPELCTDEKPALEGDGRSDRHCKLHRMEKGFYSLIGMGVPTLTHYEVLLVLDHTVKLWQPGETTAFLRKQLQSNVAKTSSIQTGWFGVL